MAYQLGGHATLCAKSGNPNDRPQGATEVTLIVIVEAAAVGVGFYPTREGTENRAVALDDKSCMGEKVSARSIARVGWGGGMKVNQIKMAQMPGARQAYYGSADLP